jgi:hypothetical protein
VLRDSAARAAARIARPVGLVAVLAWLAGAPCALAQQGTTSAPEELWRAYPLEQTATTTAPSPPAAAPDTAVSSDDGGSGPLWVVAAVAGAALVLIAVAAWWRRRRPPAAAELRIAAASPPDGAAPAARPASARPAPRRPAPVDGPVCQVRWNGQGKFFFAVTTGPDGSERGIARSPRFDWDGPTPPEPSQEPEAALKVLSKALRDQGWRPLRAKGFDFDERRWYARRFKLPSEGSTR